MKYTQVPKLIREEVKGKDVDTLIDKLLPSYNSLVDQQQSLWSSITISDNTKSKTYDFSNVTGTSMLSRTVVWDKDEAPIELRLAKLQEVSGTVLSSAPWLTWSYNKGQITFQLKGLVAASIYNIRLVAQV